MRKFLVISVIFTLILAFANSLVYASGIDMNLGSSATDSNSLTSDADTTVYGGQLPTTTAQTTSSYDATVSVGSTAALSSSSLSLSNILNIILIVLGILLVLFAIAILIRMH